ncbi:DNA-binding MarR family transcriptional regulator [Bradyrhizobium japonicum]|uniref:HTH crp-type domain-containing protein n=1 Tax=Bradyrhizobium diazoefficiens TaxID=1355477 RepID=A0A810CAY2_9BRAD|nr:helix-turn-helix domain-containing protein [Bradyrhizobium diazoefficiens]MBP1063333.1 DNA-binding MarR family transcriptional regulator [Bradyrhizobium japonicum]BCA06256.1 hypothetical protein H12S4_71600 [Bradyrhizobium diazoefficiens]BCA23607.1 hypothetical protein BDHH15_68220 [Bradyrhizobium diazoefficiens]BCE32987.1 hypothetical protein XF2B_67560 [Bradyrhizobium diazoefficiens]BCE41765.1 hypothetical protein XF3B_67960 [Bradyrhizobium diazoefficiens]
MNVTALEWARAQKPLSILEKSVLLVLASLADDHEIVAGQSQRDIAEFVGCSRQAANRALRNLATEQLICNIRDVGDSGRSFYFLNFNGKYELFYRALEARQRGAA